MTKSFVFLLCLVCIVGALPMVRKDGGRRVKLTRKPLTYQSAREFIQKIPKTSKLFQEQSPLMDDGLNDAWILGIPKNVYLFRIETGSRGVFVADGSYGGGSDMPYIVSNSNTARKLDGILGGYSGNNYWSGDKWQEIFNSGFCNITQNFAMLSSVDGGYVKNPHLTFTGLLGLGWSPEDLGATPGDPDGPIIVNALPKQAYEILFARGEENNKEEVPGWTMDFEGNRLCPENINALDLLPRTNPKFAPMAFIVDGFKFDNYEKRGPFSGRLDTAVSHIYVPSSIYSVVQRKIDIKYESDIGLSMVDCNAGDTLGNLIFTLNGQAYTIPPSEYIVNIDSPDGKCVLFVAETTFDVDFVFGLTFLQNYCSFYSFGDNQVGLASPPKK